MSEGDDHSEEGLSNTSEGQERPKESTLPVRYMAEIVFGITDALSLTHGAVPAKEKQCK
jgi:hypothetical protein